MIYSIWEKRDLFRKCVDSSTLIEGPGPPVFEDGRLQDPEAVKALEFEADSWDAANQRMHDHYQWGQYKPMEISLGIDRFDHEVPSLKGTE